VDLSGTLINGLLTIAAYIAIFFGVYKVFQIATDIRQIKELMASSRRGPLSVGAVTPSGITKDLIAEDSAAAYAEQLLRAVNAESPRTQSEPHEVR
jgi:hypothetical protein